MFHQRPNYDVLYGGMLERRRSRAKSFARQILDTTKPFLSRSWAELNVLDVGCGYGYTSLELARHCRHVVGIEPSPFLYQHAARLAGDSGLPNFEVRQTSVDEVHDDGAYDVVVLDNVLEHLAEQMGSLQRICRSLRSRGVLYIVVPNKLWPIEVHYGLPFLSYLPLGVANAYLKLTCRGRDYTDASYAPTYFALNKLLKSCPLKSFHYVLPADLSLTTLGRCHHYRLGAALLRRWSWLWPLSKAFLVIGIKE
jgi:2-polyprenyl-3-methyl-5-hydroxy-6-metoxy-1,4-benzoquinol methylase